MRYKQGEEREQIFMFSRGSAITTDALVRVVDAFVDSGFGNRDCKSCNLNQKCTFGFLLFSFIS